MYGIRVIGIAPGATADTPGFTKLIGGMNNRGVRKWLDKYVAIGRMGTKFELAMTAIFIVWNGYINGETIVVDGGSWFYSQPDIPLEKVKQIAKRIEKKSREMKGQTSELMQSKL
jgi:NAD(P)-dependent dehydrogenase (short-subunit alcohol dehydrogenase family)